MIFKSCFWRQSKIFVESRELVVGDKEEEEVSQTPYRDYKKKIA